MPTNVELLEMPPRDVFALAAKKGLTTARKLNVFKENPDVVSGWYKTHTQFLNPAIRERMDEGEQQVIEAAIEEIRQSLREIDEFGDRRGAALMQTFTDEGAKYIEVAPALKIS